METKKITLTYKNISDILDITYQLGGKSNNRNITIIESGYNGIGSCIDIEIPVIIDGVDGIFRKSIVNESDW